MTSTDFGQSRPAGVGLTLLEDVYALRDTNKVECPHPKAPLLFAVHNSRPECIVMRARCGLWTCPSCGPRNRMLWRAKIINGLNTYGGQWYFMTLTSHRWHRGGDKSLLNLRKNYPKLHSRLNRRNGGSYAYVRVYEQHEDGSYHMHMLTQCKLPYKATSDGKGGYRFYSRDLKKMCAECGLGYQADYQPVGNVGLASWYVTKYMSKFHNRKMAKGLQRIRCSNHWPELPDLRADLDFTWQHVGDWQKLKGLINWYSELGYDFTVSGLKNGKRY